MSPTSAMWGLPYVRDRLAFGAGAMFLSGLGLSLTMPFWIEMLKKLFGAVPASLVVVIVAAMVVLPTMVFVLWATRFCKKLRDAALCGSFVLCPHCAYGLSGVEPAGRSLSEAICPECGKSVDVREVEDRWRAFCREPKPQQ